MEKQRFEEAFKDAFDGAEIYPSDSVWTNIEQDLDKRSGKKGLLLLIQLLAAASMVFAMGIGSVYYLSGPQNEESILSSTNQTNTNQAPAVTNNQQKDEQASLAQSTTPSTIANSAAKNVRPTVTVVDVTNEGIQIQEGASNYFGSILEIQWGKDRLPGLVEIRQPQLILPAKSEPDPGMVLLARLRDEERKYQEPAKKKRTETLWTSIGMGAGSFNPHIAPAAPKDGVRSFGAVPTKDNTVPPPSTGTTYSVGINVANKVANRVVLQGGLSYLSQTAEYTSTMAVMGKAALNEHAMDGEDPTVTKPYKVKNNLQYMSVPLQAGYVLIDQAFAIQLNGGVSTDIFIQNTLTPENDLEKVTQKSGSDSPYRSVNFTGLLGTEVSYRVGNHYRISLNPGLRYALNSIYKNEMSGEVAPLTYDVALRFRYIFK